MYTIIQVGKGKLQTGFGRTNKMIRLVQTRVNTVIKPVRKWMRKNKKQTLVISLALKLILLGMPIGFIPAASNTAVLASNPTAALQLHLTKNEQVITTPSAILTFKPGDSNTTLEAHKRAAQSIKIAREKAVRVEIEAKATSKKIDYSLTGLRELYAVAGQKYGVPPQLLEAVHQVETGKSGDTARRSYAGATGPMQFMPATFRGYCARTGEGCDITSTEHSMYAASLLLSANYNGSWDKALFAYNHSKAYVAMVKRIANELGAQL